ncbi:MAG TPA: ankyrin repeat domain-containing protein [Puia sp.]|nr:ankyrin repeat domain-containing protein [Puia sp.]
MIQPSIVDYAEKNDVQKIREFLLSGGNVNTLEYNRNALHAACISNAKEASLELISAGIDVNSRDGYTGATPLHYCAVYNRYEIAKIIIEHGGRLDILDNYGNEPLWTAVFNVKGKEEKLPLVSLFLNNGANKNHKNHAGKSPYDFANQVKFLPLVKLLEQRGKIMFQSGC